LQLDSEIGGAGVGNHQSLVVVCREDQARVWRWLPVVRHSQAILLSETQRRDVFALGRAPLVQAKVSLQSGSEMGLDRRNGRNGIVSATGLKHYNVLSQ
jgi:hypothetical protein